MKPMNDEILRAYKDEHDALYAKLSSLLKWLEPQVHELTEDGPMPAWVHRGLRRMHLLSLLQANSEDFICLAKKDREAAEELRKEFHE